MPDELTPSQRGGRARAASLRMEDEIRKALRDANRRRDEERALGLRMALEKARAAIDEVLQRLAG